ncbi:hypothetical protein NORO109296_23040 [Nocardiopsis rhodophaea]
MPSAPGMPGYPEPPQAYPGYADVLGDYGRGAPDQTGGYPGPAYESPSGEWPSYRDVYPDRREAADGGAPTYDQGGYGYGYGGPGDDRFR